MLEIMIVENIYALITHNTCSLNTMALGLAQSLTEMTTMRFPGGKGGWLVGLTTLSPSVSRMSEKCVSLNLSQS
jgi:hypothetical protein